MDNIGPNKAVASGAVGAGATLIIFILSQFHIAIPPEVAVAAVAFAQTLATWFTPHGSTTPVA